MTMDQFIATLRAVPFRPFRMNLSDGDSVIVVHPDFAMRSPDDSSIAVYTPDKQMKIIDVFLVTSIEHVNGQRRKGKKRPRRR